MSTISVCGQTVWSCANGGLNYEANIKPLPFNVIEKETPLGGKVYIKPKGKGTSDHTLTLRYKTSNLVSLYNTFANLDMKNTYQLSIPNRPTLSKVRLVGVSAFTVEEIVSHDPWEAIVSVTLEFKQYP